jgi:hypothetical protein
LATGQYHSDGRDRNPLLLVHDRPKRFPRGQIDFPKARKSDSRDEPFRDGFRYGPSTECVARVLWLRHIQLARDLRGRGPAVEFWEAYSGGVVPIPTYDQLMLPVLRRSAEKIWTMRELIAQIADDQQLSPKERELRTPSNGSTLIASRIHWAKTYLKQAGLLAQPKRGSVQITQRGKALLGTSSTKIDVETLQQFSDFRSFMARTKPSDPMDQTPTLGVAVAAPSSTPEEQIAVASSALDETLRDALMARVLEGSPAFFEKTIVDLLLAMGYGGSRADAGEQLGGTGDGALMA